jgi:flagellar motor switch protein FliM
MLEPIKDLLDEGLKSDLELRDEGWSNALRREIMDADIDFTCSMFQQKISLRDVVDLEKGDVIPVEMQEFVVLRANGVPMFKTKLGTSGANVALKIDQVYKRPN